MKTQDGTIVLDTPWQIEGARWLAVRSALKLETKGMKRHGRSARQLANEITGEDHRRAVDAYKALDDYIALNMGEQFRHPL